ncbi:MAG TPA: pyridoxal 5'-phosphate synthase glutaminase subunit PdxT [Candidatus Dormibacteraeota bacterium]|jgi:5'-phosphate synthase pdxT subunit|nr:pyridoxal 5'-phosphate synthase glutaminase subunit PdxT [Candidatus Dormibacteraeota bacterium]
MTRPRVGVLAMQGAFREHIAALARLGADAVPLRDAAELDRLDGVVLPGGESTTMDKLLRKFGLQQPLAERIRGGLPVMATCAGVILLADEVRDGPPDQESLHLLQLKVRRNAYGRQPESFEADVDLSVLDAPFRGIFIRAPVIEEVGEGLDVLAEIEGAPVVVGDTQRLALTFHPELTGDDRIHRYFLEEMVVRATSQAGVAHVATEGGQDAETREAAG